VKGKTKKKGTQIFLWTVLAFLVLVTLCIAFLPTLLVAPPVVHSVLPHLNAALQGELQLETCSAGWRNGLECSNINLSLPQQQLRFTARRIRLDKPLYQLLFAPRNIGRVELTAPVVVYEKQQNEGLTQQNATPVQGMQEETKSQIAEKKVSEDNLNQAEKSSQKPPWEGVNVKLAITDGEFIAPDIASELGVGMEHLVRQLTLDAHLEEGTITYALSCQSGDGEGTVKAEGFFNLPITNQPIMAGLVSSTDIQVQDMDLGGVLHVVARNDRQHKIPAGSGRLTGTIALTTSGMENIGVTGAMVIADLQLEGGLLGDDKPTFEEVRLNIDVDRKEKTAWNINTFAFDSALLTVRSSGTLAGHSGALQSSGTLHLPFLVQTFPDTLKLKEDVTVTEGVVEFEGFVRQQKKTTSIQADMGTSRLVGRMNGQVVQWDDPFLLKVNVQKDGSDLFFNTLHLNTSFLDIQGSGSLDNFSLKGQADLQKSYATLENFVDIPYQASGQLFFDSSTVILEDLRYQLNTDLRINEFSLSRSDAVLVPPHLLTLSVQTKAPLSWAGGKGKMDLTLRGDTWLGKGRLLGSGVQMLHDAHHHRWVTGEFDLDGRVLLAPLSDVLHQVVPQENPVSLSGETGLQAEFWLGRDTLHIGELEAETSGFEVQAGAVAYQDQLVRVELHNRTDAKAAPKVSVRPLVTHTTLDTYQPPVNEKAVIDFSTRSMDVQHLSLDTGLLFVPFMALHVADWKDFLNDFSSQFSAEFEVENLVEVLHQTQKLSPDLSAQGRALLIGTVQGKQKTFDGNASLQAEAFTLHKQDTALLQQEDIAVKTSFKHTMGAQQILLPVLEVDSNLLTWLGSGTLRSGADSSVSLAGEATPDLELIGSLLEQVTGKAMRLKGKRSHELSFDLPLKKENALASLNLYYGGTVEAFDYQGIRLENAVLQADIEKGNGTLDVSGRLNDGNLSFTQHCTTSENSTVFSLPESQQILKDVVLDEPLQHAVLSRIHPFFGVLLQPEGVIAMQAEALEWQPDALSKTTFTTTFDVSQVKVSGNQFLNQILVMVGLDETDMTLRDGTMTCTGEDERVTCSPVHIMLADAEMTLSGTAGYDGTLDYLLRVPVTRKLVGKEGYRVLEGAVIDVPIKGGVDQPLFSRKSLEDAVGSVIKQAAANTVKQQLQKVVPGFLENIFGE